MRYNKIILSQTALSILTLPTVFGANNVQKMNVLFIAVDDLKPEIGCYGNTLIKTPNIDRIGKNGTVFLQNYCQQAVSGPTRASLMTGMRPDYTKIWDLKTLMRDINPDILSLPQYFASQGYETTGVGKIYDPRCVDKDEDKPSWTLPYNKVGTQYYSQSTGQPMIGGYQLPETKVLIAKFVTEAKEQGLTGAMMIDYVQNRIKPSTECADVPDDAYVDGAGVKRANELLTQLSKQDKPFFLAVGFAKPHLPFVAPKKYWDMYDRKDMPLAKFQEHAKKGPEIAYQNYELKSYSDIPALCSFTDNPKNIGLNIEKQRELIHGYYAATSYMDAQLGKLLDKLEELGLAKNTIIVFWGDHGWHLGDHGLWCKHTNFEQATRSPLMIVAPGMKPVKTNSVSEFVDVFPTVCELAGLQIPAKLDGKSLLPIMKNPKAVVKDFAVSQYPREGNTMGYSIRSDRYRMTFWIKNDYHSNQPFSYDLVIAKELYDYQTDPLETVNVVDDKQYTNVRADMEIKMIAFFKTQQR